MHKKLGGMSNQQTETYKLGQRIKSRRKAMNLSLRDLAKITGLSPTFVSSLERGNGNPTLVSLRKLTNALELPMNRLLDESVEPEVVVRRDQRMQLSFASDQVIFEILTPRLSGQMLLFEVRATAENGNLVGQPMPEAVEECVVVLAGIIDICLAGQTYRLDAGDSIYFESRDLESIYVVGDAEAQYLSAIAQRTA
jgi:transcriptional regulator with XRE-family HTH domain